MRRTIGTVCAVLGAFLVVVAVLCQTWAAGQLKKTPLDVDSVTRLSGSATQYTQGGILPFPVKATSTTKADSEASDDDVVVFKSSTCLVKDIDDVGDCVSADDPQGRLLSAGFDDFATDRVTAEAVNDPEYLPAEAVEHEGVVNKWPFGAEKKTYTYWVPPAGVDAVYTRTEEIDGLETYVYQVEVTDVPVNLTDDIEGLYSETTEIWIEPVTGQIVDREGEQIRKLADGSPFLDLQLAFTDEQVATNVEDISSDRDRLNLVTKTVPLIGYAVGLPLLVLGVALLVLRRRDEAATPVRAGSSKDDGTHRETAQV